MGETNILIGTGAVLLDLAFFIILIKKQFTNEEIRKE